MRVALLFSGQPRVVDGIAFKSIQDVFLSKYEVDVYAHFWDYVDTSKANTSASENIQKFKVQYSPKAIRVDPPLQEDEYSPKAISNWQRNSYSMYASLKRVYTLFESTRNGTEYDWIVRIRIDSVIFRCPDLRTLPFGRIYVPNWHGDNNPVIVNHVIIISPEFAERFFSIYDVFDTLTASIDEEYVYAYFKSYGLLEFRTALSMDIFYPSFSRDGVNPANPSPNDDNTYRVVAVGPVIEKTIQSPTSLLSKLLTKARGGYN